MQRGIEYSPPAIERRLYGIVLISVAIHAGVLAWHRAEKVQSPDLPLLVATLRAISAPAPTPSESLAEALPAPAPPKVRPQPARRESHSTPVMTTSATPAGNLAQAPVLAPQVAPETAQAPSAVHAVVTHSMPPAPSQEELLASYRRRLTDLLARHQEYPRVAAMRGWEGEVKVRVRVARKGSLIGVVLDHSSGYDVLDRHAIAMIEGLGGLPELPEAFGSSELQVVVPVTYSLRKPS